MPDTWSRIEAWLEANEPELFQCLQAGAPEAAIEELESRLALRIPDELCAIYRVRDGQAFDDSPDGVFQPYWFCSLEAVEHWAWVVRQQLAGTPNAERAFSLIPFAACHEGGTLCLDARQEPSSVWRVNAQNHEIEEAAPTLGVYLESWRESLEAGEIEYYRFDDGDSAKDNLALADGISKVSAVATAAALAGCGAFAVHGALFAAALCTWVGIALLRLTFGAFLLKRVTAAWERQVSEWRKSYPGEPWHAIPKWREGCGLPIARHGSAVTVVFHTAWLAAAAFLLWESPAAGVWAWFLSVPAGLWSGLSFLLVASRAYLHWQVGEPELRLDQVPAVVGGMLRARLRLAEQFDERTAPRAWLECVSLSRDGYCVSEDQIACAAASTNLAPDSEQLTIEVSPPPYARSTRFGARGFSVKWLLHIEAGFEKWTFLVPVWGRHAIRQAAEGGSNASPNRVTNGQEHA